jgi:hypothetical protein
MPHAARPRSRAGWLICPALVTLAAAPVRAQPAVRLEQAAGLPFEERELVDAVALRAVVSPRAPLTVAVAPGGPGRVTIGSAGRRAEAQVGARTGPAAARLVALLVVDVSRPALALDEKPLGAPGHLAVFVMPCLNFGLSDAGASLEPNAGVTWRAGDSLALLLSLGFARARAVDRAGNQVMTFDTVPLRAGVAWMRGPVALQGGLMARGYRAAAATSALGARTGAWLAAAWSFPAGAWRPFLMVALDGHTERLRLERGGQAILSAGYLAPWAGVGLAWSGGP